MCWRNEVKSLKNEMSLRRRWLAGDYLKEPFEKKKFNGICLSTADVWLID